MSHVSQYRWIMSHVSMSHVSQYRWVMSHVSMSHVPHQMIARSCVRHELVWRMSDAWPCNAMQSLRVRHDSSIRETWLIYTVRHDSSIRETRLISTWDMTYLHVRHDSLYARHDSSIRGTCLIYTRDMTRLYVRHDSCTCVPRLIHTRDMTHSCVCDMTGSYVWQEEEGTAIDTHVNKDRHTCEQGDGKTCE